jgi:hypothetical protein
MNEQTFRVEQSARPTGAAVLVSGASFAGLATAYWMNRLEKVGRPWTSKGRRLAFLPAWG